MDYLNFMFSPHTDEDEEWLRKACAPARSEKHNIEELRSMQGRLLELYSSYSSHIQQTQIAPRVTPLNDNEKSVLLNFYSSPPVGIKPLLQERRNEHALLECPFCGNPLSPNTLDHFMPKDLWPEFAIYPNNLVPQCSGCASRKSSKYYCSLERMVKFIHPIYFEALESVRFIIMVSMENNHPIFSITFALTVDFAPDVIRNVKRHMHHLDVQGRANVFCIREFLKWKRKLLRKKFDVAQTLQIRLNEIADDDIGKNWKSALYKGMLENDDVMGYLKSLSPPTAIQRSPMERINVGFEYVPAEP